MSVFLGMTFCQCLEQIQLLEMPYAVKRLSGNDTGLTGGHQAGVYLPRAFFETGIPEINTTEAYNPRVKIECIFPVHSGMTAELSAIYYNSRYFPERGLRKKYNEFRLTGWGGRESPVQHEDNTGCPFVFALERNGDELRAIALVAESLEDELLIEEWLGRAIDPGEIELSFGRNDVSDDSTELPEEWLENFPNGKTIFDYVLKRLPRDGWTRTLDDLLLARRNLEYKVYGSIEAAHVLPLVSRGFSHVDEFMKLALSVANRRKSRTGSSLEYNLAAIFDGEGVSYGEQVTTENRKKPDFIFPSKSAYHDSKFSENGLTMLAAKTCCKDRWRQVLSEANRIEHKHLFTLQDGVSPNQLQEMESGGLQLVVPRPNLSSFPMDWRPKILDLETFIGVVKRKQAS